MLIESILVWLIILVSVLGLTIAALVLLYGIALMTVLPLWKRYRSWRNWSLWAREANTDYERE